MRTVHRIDLKNRDTEETLIPLTSLSEQLPHYIENRRNWKDRYHLYSYA